ncbi:MAG TPA: NAD(P)-binding domain-containing protein [Candidatus Bathyarchaeia archaeon]|nr:NAD(P)-binding domain-containing protein [Candidatus Bathyarchaeia archaeon]
MKLKIGLVGLGIMGKPMAKNLLKAGHELVVYDVVEAPLRELEKLGAKIGRSSKAVAEQSDLVITMLPDSPDVEKAALGSQGVFEGIKSGSTYIDMSTISPVTSKKLAEAGKAKNLKILDAPVSGGEKGAIEASLTIMVGGPKVVFDECLPLFQVLGKNIVYCGGVGAGQVVKACNQILVAGVLESAGEALVLGAKAGVDPQIVFKVIASGWAMRVLDARVPLLLKRDFKPGFKTRLHYKDLSIALSAGSEYGVSLPVTSLIREMMGAMKVAGRGDFDHSGIITILEDLAKFEVKA